MPGSLLLFPCVENRPASGISTIVSVTNTNTSRLINPRTNLRQASILADFLYVEGRSPWRSFRRYEYLTPGDMISVIAAEHNPDLSAGFLVVAAVDPEQRQAVDFDFLTGDALVLDLAANGAWSVVGVSFRSQVEETVVAPVRSSAGFAFTDRNGNQNGAYDFDGVEYDLWPDRLFVASFLEQSQAVQAWLVFVSGLGSGYEVEVDFLFYDNEEDVFSRGGRFRCWTQVRLDEVSLVTRALHGTPAELPAGWICIDGRQAYDVVTGRVWDNETPGGSLDPPILGLLIHKVKPLKGFTFAHVLHVSGAQNGDDLPHVAEN